MNRLLFKSITTITFIQEDQMKPQELIKYSARIDEKYVVIWVLNLVGVMIFGEDIIFYAQKLILIRCREGQFCADFLKMIPLHDGA